MGNPEKIEIEGLKTIHKLCKFGADHNMEGCTFTEIVERMFSKIEQMKTQVNTLDEMLLNQGEVLALAKAQAVPEGFVLVPSGVLDLTRFMCETWAEIDKFVYKNCQNLELYPLIQGSKTQSAIRKIGNQKFNPFAVGVGIQAMIEAQEQK